jgi:hypothetical protein
MKKWRVGGGIAASTYVGEFEAATWQEAIAKAYKVAGVFVCRKCAEHISDPEIDHLWAEDEETGDCTSEPTLGDQVSEQAREIERLRAALTEAQAALQQVAEYDSDPYKSWTLTKEACRDALLAIREAVKP